VQQAGQRRLQPVQNHLGLRVAEARVEFDHADARRREAQAGVEQAGVRRPAAAHRVDGGLHDGRHDLVGQAGRGPRERAVGTHATRVRAEVAVVGALEVLGGHQRHGGGPVGQREQ
jgi:hypothetical protein